MTWNAKSQPEALSLRATSRAKSAVLSPNDVPFKQHSLSEELASLRFKDSEVRVLVVDDNSVNRQVVLHMVQQFGCGVDVVENGAAAIAATRDTAYALVFMDCLMPVMDGWKAAQAIRKIPGPSQKTRIVAMTACALQEDKRRCRESGMDAFLQKPLTLNGVAEELLGLKSNSPNKIHAKIKHF